MNPHPTRPAAAGAAPRMTEVSGAEALWMLGGVRTGRLIFTVDHVPGVRPARHLVENGTVVVRVPLPPAVLTRGQGRPDLLVYQADDVDATGGWQVTATGPAEPVTHPDEAAHYRATLPGWAHGPHDALLRLHPHLVHGHRLDPLGPARPREGAAAEQHR